MKQFVKIIAFAALFFTGTGAVMASEGPLLIMSSVQHTCENVNGQLTPVLSVTLDNLSMSFYGTSVVYTITGGIYTATNPLILDVNSPNSDMTVNPQTFQTSALTDGVTYTITANAPPVGGNTLTFVSATTACSGGCNSPWTGVPDATTPTVIYNNNTAVSNVGIGTTTPSEKLQIVGGNILLDRTNVSATTGNIFLGGVTYPTLNNGMRLSYFNGSDNGFIDVRTSTLTDGLIFRVDNDPNHAGTERMRLSANGQLSVGNRVVIGGTQTPAAIGNINTSNYRLFVRGGILTEQLVVFSGAPFPDYVFEPGYKLMPLEAIERHIKEEGHLPNTPSATEVGQNGLNMGDLAVNHQEKIEELFLYVIQLNKAVQALKAENQALKNQRTIQNNTGDEK